MLKTFIISSTNRFLQSNRCLLTKNWQLNPSTCCIGNYSTEPPTKPDPLQRIYYGSLTPRIRAVKLFSISTSIMGITLQPWIVQHSSEIGGTPFVIFACTFVGIFTFVTPVGLHLITKRYVTEMSYDSETKEYTATTVSLFLRKHLHKFKVEDVRVPEMGGMFTTFCVHGKPLFVEATQFDDPNHYVRIMGYDRPIDLKLGPVIGKNVESGKGKEKGPA